MSERESPIATVQLLSVNFLMMMNCFCEVVELQTAGSHISSRDHRQVFQLAEVGIDPGSCYHYTTLPSILNFKSK